MIAVRDEMLPAGGTFPEAAGENQYRQAKEDRQGNRG